MEDLDIRLKEKEQAWIRIYFEAHGNATEATRIVYGGTPISCMVKGHISDNVIMERGFDKMSWRGLGE